MVDPESENNLFKKISEMDEIPEYIDRPGSVVYFPGCAGTYINKVMAQASVALLEKAGVDYTVLSGLEYCCGGAVSAGAGDQALSASMGRKILTKSGKEGGQKSLSLPAPGVSKLLKIFIHACLENWTLKFCRSLSTLTGF